MPDTTTTSEAAATATVTPTPGHQVLNVNVGILGHADSGVLLLLFAFVPAKTKNNIAHPSLRITTFGIIVITVDMNIYRVTHSIVANFSGRNWPFVGPKLPSPWSDGSSC
jgi:hypothetical protein